MVQTEFVAEQLLGLKLYRCVLLETILSLSYSDLIKATNAFFSSGFNSMPKVWPGTVILATPIGLK